MALSGLDPKSTPKREDWEVGLKKIRSRPFGEQDTWISHAVSTSLFSNTLKQKMLDALYDGPEPGSSALRNASRAFDNAYEMLYSQAESPGSEVYDAEYDEPPLTGELAETARRLQVQMAEVSEHYAKQAGQQELKLSESATEYQNLEPHKTLSQDPQRQDAAEDASSEGYQSGIDANLSIYGTTESKISIQQKNQTTVSGGTMADLSGYKDLSKAPLSLGADDELTSPSLERTPTGFADRPEREISQFDRFTMHASPVAAQGFADVDHDVDTEFSGNVKTLIRLVNELPQDVTKQTGAQIIRLTMEAMGISMEDVLSEAQSAQSEMLDAVRANIKKIEEYKTVIRKLETDIKYFQGKANELSEIIDLFILSNTASSSGSLETSNY